MGERQVMIRKLYEYQGHSPGLDEIFRIGQSLTLWCILGRRTLVIHVYLHLDMFLFLPLPRIGSDVAQCLQEHVAAPMGVGFQAHPLQRVPVPYRALTPTRPRLACRHAPTMA
jgi:hypothetical protein